MTTMEIASELDRIYDTNLTNDLVKSLTQRSYTLDEIKTLALKWCDEFDASDLARLTVSTLLVYLRKREKEGEG